MHLIKPTWLAHGGDLRDFEVYSCHVSPDGKRLATAGGDGYIRLWSTEAIRNSDNPAFTGPRQLAAVSNHTGTIHAVRFSPNNKYLASGADDKIVCVYSIEAGKPVGKVFGSDEAAPVENWRVLRRLIGHENDVQDLGWSHDSSILVSVGLDSKVVIWSGYTFEKLKTLGHHQSHVKGIAFDPANKYFATASDDRTVRIYRFSPPGPASTAQDQAGNYILETTVREPFEGSPLTTYFRRCSWSPDGFHVAAANAVNGPVRSVAIIMRGTWESEINLIGHEGPVEVCAFSPRLFYPDDPAEADPNDKTPPRPALTVVACAGQDKTVSVWNTTLSRPFVILQDASRKSVSDLAWAPDGEELYVTSLDGSIFVAVFERGELGYVAPEAEKEKSLARFGGGRKARLLESVEGVLLEEASREAEAKGVDDRLGELMGGAAVSADKPAGADKINGSDKTAAGVAATAETNGALAAPGPAAAVAPTSAPAPSPATAPAPAPAPAAAPAPAPAEAAEQPNPVDELKQRVTYTKDGRKKIRPVLISGSADQMSTLPASRTVTQTALSTQAEVGHAALDLSKPYDRLPATGLAGLIFGHRRRFADSSGRVERRVAAAAREGIVPILVDTGTGLTTADDPAVQQERPIVNPATVTSRLRLSVPTLRPLVQRTVDGTAPDDRGVTPTIAIHNTPRSASRVVCSAGPRALWTDFLPRPVLLMTGNDRLWAAGCDDGSVIVWTPAGRRLFAPLVLDAAAVVLDCSGDYLLAISAVGLVHVWNIRLMQAEHAPVSLAPVLDGGATSESAGLASIPGLVFARLTSAGTVVVAMSNGTAFTYTARMAIWQRVAEPWWAVTSQYWNTSSAATMAAPSAGSSASTSAPLGSSVIPFLERHTTTHALVRGRSFFLQRLVKTLLVAESFEGLETAASVGHLETRLAAALALGAKDEFRSYLLTYAKRIGAERMGDRVKEVLDGLVHVPNADDPSDLEDEQDDGDGEDDGEEKEETRTSKTGDSDGKWKKQVNSTATAIDTLRLGSGPASGPAGLRSGSGGSDQAGTAWQDGGSVLCGWDRMELLADVVKVLGKYRDLHRMVVPYARLVGLVGDSGASFTRSIPVDDRMEE